MITLFCYLVLSFYSPRVCEGREQLHCRSAGQSGWGTSTTAVEMTQIYSTDLNTTITTKLMDKRQKVTA